MRKLGRVTIESGFDRAQVSINRQRFAIPSEDEKYVSG